MSERRVLGRPGRLITELFWRTWRRESRVFRASSFNPVRASSYLSFNDLHNDAGLYGENDPLICVVWFRGAFSLTKTATGILFKFSNIDDYQAVYKKGFHKVTGARFYKKVQYPKKKEREKKENKWRRKKKQRPVGTARIELNKLNFGAVCSELTASFLSARFSCSRNFSFV